jgi:hypothetical protein
VLWHPGPPGDPHARRPDPGLLRITADEVLTAFGRLPEPEAAARPTGEGRPAGAGGRAATAAGTP